MALEVYRTEFTNIDGDDFVIDICNEYSSTQRGGGSVTDSFTCGDSGFDLNYTTDDDTFIGLYPSYVKYELIAESNSDYNTIRGILDAEDETWLVIIYKDEALFWEGFLNPMDTTYDYSTGIQSFSVSAFDFIANLKGSKIWSQWPGLFGLDPERPQTSFQPYEQAINHHGLGDRENQTPSVGSDNQIPSNLSWSYNGNSYTKGFQYDWTNINPSGIIQYVYSLLYDMVSNEMGEKHIYSASWDINRNASPVQPNSDYDWFTDSIKIDTRSPIFDFTEVLYSSGYVYPGTDEAADCYTMLNEITKYCRARLFQHNGIYHFIQVEAWELYNPSPSPVLKYADTSNALRTGLPAGTITKMPTKQTEETYTASNASLTLTSPRTQGMSNVRFSMVEGFREVILTIPETRISAKQMKGEKFKTVVNQGGHNTFTNHRTTKYELNIKTFGYKDVQVYSQPGQFSQIIRRYGATPDPVWNENGDMKQHLTTMLAEYHNGAREKLNMTLINANYNILKKVVFNSKDYLPQKISYNAEMGAWSGEWLEYNKDTTNVGTQSQDV